MERRDEEPTADLSQEFDSRDGDRTKGLKQFSECECERPIVDPISYVLPDHQFISLLHCKACNGLSRYSITELPNEEEKDVSEEELETVESLLEDINALEDENSRLRQKLRRQSRRMRITQGAKLTDREQAVSSPEPEPSSKSEQTESQVEQQDSELNSNSSSISPAARKVLFASLVLGVGITGAVVWTTTTLSGAAIVIGTLLIIFPVFFLTDGEIPQNHKGG